MKKILIIFILLLSSASVNAITYEDAIHSYRPMALYIYMNGCPYCERFDSVFDNARIKYGSRYNFVKQEYRSGMMPTLCNTWRVKSFPFMALINPKTNSGKRIASECMWNSNCLDRSFQDFRD